MFNMDEPQTRDEEKQTNTKVYALSEPMKAHMLRGPLAWRESSHTVRATGVTWKLMHYMGPLAWRESSCTVRATGVTWKLMHYMGPWRDVLEKAKLSWQWPHSDCSRLEWKTIAKGIRKSFKGETFYVFPTKVTGLSILFKTHQTTHLKWMFHFM